jgi:hypothetical protein
VRTPASLLVLNDDELALLRFTGDLFFVDESPLIHVERAAREPNDYAGSYQALVDRGVIDPHGFRITDEALNQIAPVTECDARIVHVIVDGDGTVTQEDHWLLDEIAVIYERSGEGDQVKHVFGPDLDPHQLVQRLGRHLTPRRSGGDRFDATLSAVEVLATVLLLDASGRHERRILTMEEARTALQRLPAEDGFAAVVPGGLHGVANARLTLGKKVPTAREARSPEATIRDLVAKGVLLNDGLGLRLHQTLHALVSGGRRRHTLVRTDFRDDDWLVREVTLLPVEGSLLVIAPTRGGFRIAELDGDALFDVLREATGPHVVGDKPPPAPQRLAALLAGQPRR